jgi:hypothetical protein
MRRIRSCHYQLRMWFCLAAVGLENQRRLSMQRSLRLTICPPQLTSYPKQSLRREMDCFALLAMTALQFRLSRAEGVIHRSTPTVSESSLFTETTTRWAIAETVRLRAVAKTAEYAYAIPPRTLLPSLVAIPISCTLRRRYVSRRAQPILKRFLLVGRVVFTVSTCGAFGTIRARRVQI